LRAPSGDHDGLLPSERAGASIGEGCYACGGGWKAIGGMLSMPPGGA